MPVVAAVVAVEGMSLRIEMYGGIAEQERTLSARNEQAEKDRITSTTVQIFQNYWGRICPTWYPGEWLNIILSIDISPTTENLPLTTPLD